MDSHPKKKKSTEQIRNQTTVTSLAEINTVYTLYKAKANQTPLPNTAIQRCLQEKKRNQIQSKPNPRPRANQTHGGAATARRRSSLRDLRRSSSSSLVARRLPVAADRRSVSPSQLLRCSALRYFFLFFSLTLSQSLTLSHTKMKNMK